MTEKSTDKDQHSLHLSLTVSAPALFHHGLATCPCHVLIQWKTSSQIEIGMIAQCKNNPPKKDSSFSNLPRLPVRQPSECIYTWHATWHDGIANNNNNNNKIKIIWKTNGPFVDQGSCTDGLVPACTSMANEIKPRHFCGPCSVIQHLATCRNSSTLKLVVKALRRIFHRCASICVKGHTRIIIPSHGCRHMDIE